ncbi:MAG: hypothetical protein LLG42_01250 [Chloroflexi bacterium]|nr:hypothetical protein [Chloroflexota bacterium]
MPSPPTVASNDALITGSTEPARSVEMPAYVEYTSGSLWLRLYTPMDGDVVTQPVIDVIGQSPAETVISLNESIFLVGDEGSFSIPVTLDEGPNVIELIASNMDSDEIELVLTIMYEKE